MIVKENVLDLAQFSGVDGNLRAVIECIVEIMHKNGCDQKTIGKVHIELMSSSYDQVLDIAEKHIKVVGRPTLRKDKKLGEKFYQPDTDTTH